MTDYRRARIPGASYFFTIATANRDASMLTDHIGLLRAAFREVHTRHPFTTNAIVVLPDNLHCVWTIPDVDYSTRWNLI